mgnify:CR=1 FL=1
MYANAKTLVMQGALEPATVLQRRILEINPDDIDWIETPGGNSLKVLRVSEETGSYTALFKAEAGCSMSVTLHPDDAAWLADAATVRERLRIREIKEDRRLEAGGAVVKIDDLEWDATIASQLERLGQVVEEAVGVRAEAAQPFYPELVPIDAYNAGILDEIDLQQ